MPFYRINQREIVDSIFEVEADNLADAIEVVWNGGGAVLDTQFVDVDDREGVSMYDSSISEKDREVLIKNGLVSHDWTTQLKGISKVEKLT
jgi:hypothetical protein